MDTPFAKKRNKTKNSQKDGLRQSQSQPYFGPTLLFHHEAMT
jgi:hypothetical protein